ncbi:unnamed protein product [Peronospora belbahrii]|uniref:Heat shock factor-binding protein 1 n=1 Tax=Peronospora belbahrii TaxID=622444 RepID=A0AAU9L1A2_9STRA|nr:unnamed protein product [Peronospora belbahrii]CAH0517494.1 unnamed protein product [Peronospora belbahrii]
MSSSDASKTDSGPTGGPTDAQDLTVFVQSLLEQMQSRFAQMSDAIIGRIDEMGSRIDDLEKSIADLIEQTNEDGINKNQEMPASAAQDKVERV